MRILAAALLALTTVFVGFAHRPPRLEPRGYGGDFAAYVLPDGTLPGICLWDDLGGRDPGDHGRDRAAAICDACLLTSSPGLGAVAQVAVEVPEPHVIGRRVTVVAGFRLVTRAPRPASCGPPTLA